MTALLKTAERFDYELHGENIGSYCPLLDGVCAVETDSVGFATDRSRCPHDCDLEDGPEWSKIVTANGFVTPDPLDEI